MGTSDFAVPALEKLNKEYEISLVVTQPDRINQRGNKIKFGPIKQKALDLGLEVYQPQKISDQDSFEKLSSLEPDLFVVCAFGQILKENILNIPKYGSLNIHGSILPEYRGAAPIHHAIIDGKDESGVTIMVLDPGMDTGDILTWEKKVITDKTTVGEYHDLLAQVGAELLIKTIPDYLNKTIKPIKQDNKKATYADKIVKQNCKVNWNKTNHEILRFINGLDPYPGSFSYYKNKRIKLTKPELLEENFNVSPGTIVKIVNGKLVIQCGQGSLLFDEIQYPGKKKMKVSDFLRGNNLDTDIILN